MKKIFSMILAVMMVMGLLAACADSGSTNVITAAPTTTPTTTPSDSADPEPPEPEKPSDEEFSGEMQDAPDEKFTDSNKLYFLTENELGETADAGLELDGDTLVFYISDGDSGYTLYELVGDEEIRVFISEDDGETYEEYTDEFTQDEIAQYYSNDFLGMCGIVLFYDYGAPEGTEYKKVASEKRDTGKAYKYEVYVDGEYAMDMWVDEDTGVCVELRDVESDEAYLVTEISMTDAKIPEYK